MIDKGAVQIKFVLVEPKHPGNVGAAARALKNMGFGGLALSVRDEARRAELLGDEAERRAVHANDVLSEAQVAATLSELIPPHALVVATTARERPGAATPRELAATLLSESRRRPVTILFGPEDTGLHLDELDRAARFLRVPTDAEQPSLNLASAVLIVAYELSLALADGTAVPPTSRSTASAQALEGFHADLEESLAATGFLQERNRRRVLTEIRELFARLEPSQRELTLLRGILRQFRWLNRQAQR